MLVYLQCLLNYGCDKIHLIKVNSEFKSHMKTILSYFEFNLSKPLLILDWRCFVLPLYGLWE